MLLKVKCSNGRFQAAFPLRSKRMRANCFLQVGKLMHCRDVLNIRVISINPHLSLWSKSVAHLFFTLGQHVLGRWHDLHSLNKDLWFRNISRLSAHAAHGQAFWVQSWVTRALLLSLKKALWPNKIGFRWSETQRWNKYNEIDVGLENLNKCLDWVRFSSRF